MERLKTEMGQMKTEIRRLKTETPRQVLLVLILLAVILLVFPNFLGPYQVHILNVTLYYIVIVSAWNLLAGYTGIFSLAHAALAAAGAYTTALLSYHFGVHPILGIILGGFVAAFVSYAIGSLTLNMRGIYLVSNPS